MTASAEDIAAVKKAVSHNATQIWRILAEAGVDAGDMLIYAGMGVIWALGSREAGITREAFLSAAADAYDNAVGYAEAIEEAGEAVDILDRLEAEPKEEGE